MTQRTAATGSERQAKYRRARQLSAVFLTKATREAINALQARTGLKKEALLALAIRNLTAELERKERRRIRPSSAEAASLAMTSYKAVAEAPSSPTEGSSSRPELPGNSSLGDVSDTLPAPAAGGRSAEPTELAGKWGAGVRTSGRRKRGGDPQSDLPDLFGDLPSRR